MKNKAKQDKLDLHHRFWLNPEWSKYYRNQIGTANQLLKKYSPKAIIKALQDNKAQKIYSLRAPHLVAIIDQYQSIVDSENTEFTKDIERKEVKTYRKEQPKTSLLSKLKELDDES